MKISDLKPLINDRNEFSLSKAKFIPSQPGCYVLTNFQGDIMYIGQAVNLQRRMIQHLDNIEKTKLTSFGKVYYFYFKIIDEQHNLNKVERGMINHFEITEGKIPILNSIHAPI